MTTNWQFDKAFLEAAIAKGEVMLKDKNLSRINRQSIRYDLASFKRFLKGDFENHDVCTVRPPKGIEKLKGYILRKMEKQYKTLGPELIKWIIELSEQQIFDMYTFSPATELTLDDQAELTIQNYERNSHKFLVPAKQIISNDTIKQIQLVEFLDCSSYCHHDDITGLPYLIVDPTEAPWILNHEIEHAIESILGYSSHTLYSELGSQFFEMLFTEELYRRQGSISLGDFQDRVDDTQYFLTILSEYFKIMLTFAATNFQVPTQEFLKTFEENKDIEPDSIIEYLTEEIATDEQVDNMCYLFSFLKAIELREKALDTKTDCADLLEPYLTTRRFKFSVPQDGYKVYERYIKEVNQKVKTKK